jgi:NiFe hydrogenase small subunit HydA
MLNPMSHPWVDGETLGQHLEERGVSRREFLEWCGSMCAVLGLSNSMLPRIAQGLQATQRPSVIWLQLQECTGCVESVLRTAEPTIGDLVLDLVSLDYQHTLMAGAGSAVEKALADSMAANRGKYVLIVTGSVPLKDDGIYCTIGGRTAKEIVTEAGKGAAAVIAVGACAHWGSVQAARRDQRGDHRQTSAQHRRMPTHRRRRDGHDRSLSHLRAAAGDGQRGPPALRVREADSRPVPATRAFRCRPVRRGLR